MEHCIDKKKNIILENYIIRYWDRASLEAKESLICIGFRDSKCLKTF